MHRSRFARYLCVGVDAEGYGARDSVAQYEVQHHLAKVLREAATAAGLDRDQWLIQPQGDGEIALLPPGQPEPRVVDDFVRELDACLALHNFERRPETRLRLRVAVHFGVAYQAPEGFAGDGVVVTARLLGSTGLHRALEETADADMAVALSDRVYTDTVLQRHTSLRPDQFARVEVSEKEYAGPAWIRVLSRGAGPGGSGGMASPRQEGTTAEVIESGTAAGTEPEPDARRSRWTRPLKAAGLVGAAGLAGAALSALAIVILAAVQGHADPSPLRPAPATSGSARTPSPRPSATRSIRSQASYVPLSASPTPPRRHSHSHTPSPAPSAYPVNPVSPRDDPGAITSSEVVVGYGACSAWLDNDGSGKLSGMLSTGYFMSCAAEVYRSGGPSVGLAAANGAERTSGVPDVGHTMRICVWLSGYQAVQKCSPPFGITGGTPTQN